MRAARVHTHQVDGEGVKEGPTISMQPGAEEALSLWRAGLALFTLQGSGLAFTVPWESAIRVKGAQGAGKKDSPHLLVVRTEHLS